MTHRFRSSFVALAAIAFAACTSSSPATSGGDASPNDAPVTDTPVTDVPVTDVPVTDVPVTDVPVTDVPVTDVPVADVPVSDVPVSDVATDAPTSCASNADCPSGQVCEFALGCDQTRGVCHSNGCQSLPVAPQYCGCDGRTIQQVSACLPDRAYRSMGACPDAGAVDAGTADVVTADVARVDVTAADATGDAGGLPLGAECAGGGVCADGLLCCYPCGIPGCVNRCMTPMAGHCPLIP